MSNTISNKTEWNAELDANLNEFHAKVKRNRWHDDNFAKEDDVELTEEEIKAIDEYWGRFSFAYPEIYYDSFKTFKNRCGRFDVRHCPGSIREFYFRPFFVNSHYIMAHQNKGMYPLLYPDVPKPVTVVRRMARIYYDSNYNPIDFTKAVDIIMENLGEGRDIIVKPSALGGGQRITFLYAKDDEDENYRETVEAAIKAIGINAFVAQHVIDQSSFMKQFNESSLNTIRITTFLWKGKVTPLGALIRIGSPGSKVDNYTQGGAVLGVDVKTGICNNWAMMHDLEKVTQLPSGLILDEKELHIPNFDKIIEHVVRMHYMTPYNKLISWDMALDEDDVPTMIENNFAGSLQLHEAVNGPLFEEYMDELTEAYLLKYFNVEFRTDEWVFQEFHDHVVAKLYRHNSDNVTVPAEMKGKPVTGIESNAFKKCIEGVNVTLPEGLKDLPVHTFKKVLSVTVEEDKVDSTEEDELV